VYNSKINNFPGCLSKLKFFLVYIICSSESPSARKRQRDRNEQRKMDGSLADFIYIYIYGYCVRSEL
jgi:hypothetical protein